MWHLKSEKAEQSAFTWCGEAVEMPTYDGHVTTRQVLGRDDWRPEAIFCPTCVARERAHIQSITPKGKGKHRKISPDDDGDDT